MRRHGRISPRPWPIPFHLHWSVAGWRVAGGGQRPGRPADRSLPHPPPATRHEDEWEDLFDGNGDPRDFDDVVKCKGLAPEQLRRAGVAEGVARRAGGR